MNCWLEATSDFSDLRPAPFAILHEKVCIESYAALDFLGYSGSMSEADLLGNVRCDGQVQRLIH